MVKVQPSSASEERVLIGSDQTDREAARQEIDAWVTANHYRVDRKARPLAFYEDGVLVREWLVAERDTKHSVSFLSSFFGFRNRPANDDAPAVIHPRANPRDRYSDTAA